MNKTALGALLATIPTIGLAAPEYSRFNYGSFSYQITCEQTIGNNTYCQAPKPNASYSLQLTEEDSSLIANPLPRYLQTSSERDWDYLLEQTYTILGLSVATAGLMTFLPESITKWDSEQSSFSDLGSKWWDNVSAGPVWDKDEHYLNYIMHPYFGGVYYMSARHSGFNEFESFLYSFGMSTFFWEYGVESFAEVPSWQDIFITPFFGALVGESMYNAEYYLVNNMDGKIWGSETLGDVSLFFLNPVGHIHHWVTNLWGDNAETSFNTTPWFGNTNAAQYALDAGAPVDTQFMSLNFTVRF